MNLKYIFQLGTIEKYAPWIILSTISISLFVYSTWCGLGITYDSKDYLFAAQTWSNNYTLLNANLHVFQERTPLFPIILSCLDLNTSVILFAFGMSYWLILNGTLYFYCQEVQSTSQRIFFSFLLAFSTPLLLITNYLWSEVFFTLFLLVSSYFLLKFSKDQTNYKAIAFAIAFAFLYCLQRNTGIFFVMGSAFFLLLECQNKKTFILTFIYAALSLSGWAIWTTYHYSQRGLDFQPTLYEIGENIFPNIITYVERFSLWLLPNTTNMLIRVMTCFTLLIVLLVFLLTFLRKNHATPRGKTALFLLILILNYLGGMSLLERANEWEVDRFIAILYPFCLLLLAFVVNDYYMQLSGLKKHIVQILLCIYLVYPCVRSVKNSLFWHKTHCIDMLNTH